MSIPLDIDIAWGGYYASIPLDGGEIRIFRLLDFNQYAYHAALFTEKFATVPTVEELLSLSPFIGHAPIDARALVLQDDELRLIGDRALSGDDLEGYMTYLEAHEVAEDKQNELAERLIAYSTEPPLSLRLEIVDDELVILDRE